MAADRGRLRGRAGDAERHPAAYRPGLDAVGHFENDEAAYRKAKEFFANHPAMNNVRTLRDVIAEGLDNYAGVFVPGGQAPVVDLMQDADWAPSCATSMSAQKPTALLCHGPIAVAAAMPHAREFRAALLAGEVTAASNWAKDWQYAGDNMTVFSNTEEKIVEDHILHAKLYFNMVDALQAAGGKVIVNAVDFEPNVIEDRELITGQNPRSDHPLAKRLVAALNRATATQQAA